MKQNYLLYEKNHRWKRDSKKRQYNCTRKTYNVAKTKYKMTRINIFKKLKLLEKSIYDDLLNKIKEFNLDDETM